MRLIDADALMPNAEYKGRYDVVTAYDIANAPTIEPEPHWIPCSERLPENNVPVNITWVNRNPESYYADIKDHPFTATGVHYNNKWYWYSATIVDVLAEYGRAEWDEIEESMHESIEVIAWMPMPEPYEERKEQ